MWWPEIKWCLFSFVHKLWVPILWWPIWNHHYCFCSVPSDLYYHLSYEAKMWENAKVGVMPNHQGQIDCHSIWFWMSWNISVYLFIYSWSKKVNILFAKFLSNTFKMFRIKLPLCGIIPNSGLFICNFITFSW